MPSELAISAEPPEHRASAFPELLHALAQPLTSLRCSLEATLLYRRDTDEYRSSLRDSLRLAEEVSAWAAGIRELLDAETAPQRCEPLAMGELLNELVAERLEVARSNRKQISLSCEPGAVCRGNRTQLTKALTYLIDYALEIAPSGNVAIALAAAKPGIQVTLTSTAPARGARAGRLRVRKPATGPFVGFLIARGIFALAGGSLEEYVEGRTVCVRGKLGESRG